MNDQGWCEGPHQTPSQIAVFTDLATVAQLGVHGNQKKLVCCLEKWKENQVIWFLCGYHEAKEIFWQMIKTRMAKAT